MDIAKLKDDLTLDEGLRLKPYLDTVGKLTIEEWREVPEFPLYEVSSLGRVRSKLRTYQRKNPRNGVLMTVPTGGRLIKGWVKWHAERPSAVVVSMRREGKTYQDRLHRLVLLAFVGPCPDGMEGCHNDGNPLNNALSNLRWDTHQANMEDARVHGTRTAPPIHVGESHPRSKLTASDVREIRSTPIRRGVLAELSRRYGVTIMTIDRVLKREVWRHVT